MQRATQSCDENEILKGMGIVRPKARSLIRECPKIKIDSLNEDL